MRLRYYLTMWVLFVGALFSGVAVTGCAATREIMDRLLGNHRTHEVRLDFAPLREEIDEWLDIADEANKRMDREDADASR